MKQCNSCMCVVWWFRIIIKNLLLGYFHTPPSKRREALQVIGQVLSYSRDEMKEVHVLYTYHLIIIIIIINYCYYKTDINGTNYGNKTTQMRRSTAVVRC